MAFPFLDKTALESPTLAQNILFPIIITHTIVAPHFYATSGKS